MKLEYSLYVLIYPLLYALLMQVAPDFPGVFSADVFSALLSYVLTKLGVEIVGSPLRGFLVARGLSGFKKSK